jgi:DNA-binding transcriptional MocR family regulator
MRNLYAERREFFVEYFNKSLGKYFILQIPDAGLHFVAWLRRKENLPVIIAACENIGIRPSPLSSCFMKAELDPALTFGFAAWTRSQIREGLAKFAAALESKIPA